MTSRDDHERAQDAAALVVSGDATAKEWAFLEAHNAACARCAEAARGLEQARAALRSVAIPPAPALLAITRRRVQERSLELREERSRRRGLAVSGVLAALLTLGSAFSVWRVFEGMGWTALPWVWAPVGLGLWFLPGVLAGAAAWAAGSLERKEGLTQ